MKFNVWSRSSLRTWPCLALALACATSIPAHSRPQTGTNVTLHAKGSFEVQLAPVPGDDVSGGVTLGRFTGDKQFHGDFEGTSRVQMLTAVTSVKDSKGYVAMERLTGSLAGRTGSLVLQHSATMNRGTPQISVTIVPDSGSGQLTGIYGSMTIEIADGKHFYDLAYTLPEQP